MVESKSTTKIELEDSVDFLKRKRTTLRRLLSTAFNQLTKLQEGKADVKEIELQYDKIVDKSDRLFSIDEKLSRLTEFSEEEDELVESYREKFIEIKSVYKSCVQAHRDLDEVSVVGSLPGVNLRLPKLTLKEFDLSPRTWVAFWGQFCRIHEDGNLREEDKFQYLLSSIKPKTKARDIVESYPPSKENYEKVIEHLKSRFGRDDLLIEVYIRDLLNLVSNRSNIKLSELYDKLGSYLRALETLGVTTQNYAAMLYPVVESCLSTEVLKAWNRYRISGRCGEEEVNVTKEKLLENLMTFLSHEVEGEEHRVLAENAFGNSSLKKDRYQSDRDAPTASALTTLPGRSSVRPECIFCNNPHSSQDCRKASSMSLDERKIIVKRSKCCLVCLKTGHFLRQCKSKIRCLICNQRHVVLLCPDLRKKEDPPPENREVTEVKSTAMFTAQHSQREMYLKTLMVRICHNEKKICARALLDDGSHCSYIEKSLAAELGLEPKGTEILSQGLFGGGTTPATEHRRYEVTLEALSGKFSSSFYFLDQHKICTKLPRIRDEELLYELSARGITLTDIGKDVPVPPIRILLGADCLGGILTGRVEVFRSGISAVETLLGWSVLGLGKKLEVLNLVDENLQNLNFCKIWDLELLSTTDPAEAQNKKLLDEETLDYFEETLKFKSDQRYEVTLPWLVRHPPLHSNREIAESRLRVFTERLKEEDKLRAYHDIFLLWKSEVIVEGKSLVLNWIKKKKPWKEIRELTDINSLRHVPGHLDPADLPLRSCTWLDLFNQKEWWERSTWLREPEISWPVANSVCPEEALVGRKRVAMAAPSVQDVLSHDLFFFSSYSMMTRMIAWIFGFCRNSLKIQEKTGKEVAGEECQDADCALMGMFQKECSVEYRKKYEKSMKFYEHDGLLKVQTQLIYGEFTDYFHPPTVLLVHIITRSLIEHTHKNLNHAVVQTTLAQFYERFWIPRGRRIIREMIFRCVPLGRHSAKQPTEAIPLLPERFQRGAAFQVTCVYLAVYSFVVVR